MRKNLKVCRIPREDHVGDERLGPFIITVEPALRNLVYMVTSLLWPLDWVPEKRPYIFL